MYSQFKVMLILLGILVCVNVVASNVYHITPSSSMPCPASPCLTFSQFATNSRSYLSYSTKLIFLSGNYTLTCNVSISNIGTFSMLSHSQSVQIFCKGNTGLELAGIDDVYLNRIKFTGCQGHNVKLVGQFILNDTTFSYHTGTVLQLVNSTAQIVRCSFISNSFGSHRDVIGVVYDGSPLSVLAGAAITTASCSLTIIGSTFRGNSAEVGGAIFAELKSSVTIINSTFVANHAYSIGGVLYSKINCTVLTFNSTFQNNLVGKAGLGGTGRVFTMHNGTLFIQQCSFINNTGISSTGIISMASTSVVISDSKFIYNGAFSGEGIMFARDVNISISGSLFKHNYGNIAICRVLGSSVINIDRSEFENNTQGVLNVRGGYIYINESNFTSNSADEYWYGGVMWAATTNISIKGCNFINNSAYKGGVLEVGKTNLNVSASTFANNSAFWGGVVRVIDSIVRIWDDVITDNQGNQGTMHFLNSTITFLGQVQFHNNKGSLIAHYSMLTLMGESTFINCSPLSPVDELAIYSEGGVITAFQSEIFLNGECSFVNNSAKNGGAIHAAESKIYVYKRAIFSNNTAMDAGGGLYLYQSKLNCHISSTFMFISNSATKKGGGILMISSTFQVSVTYTSILKQTYNPPIYFVENSAPLGGGICLEMNAKLYIIREEVRLIEHHHILFKFTGNSADHGGAIYVADDTNSGICASISYKVHASSTECFIQTLALRGKSPSEILTATLLNINFTHNIAHVSGPCLFGGLLDRCTVSPFGETRDIHYTDSGGQPYGIEYLKMVSNISDLRAVSSQPDRVCFCRNSQPDCNNQSSEIHVKKGEKFSVSLVAVDQANNTVINANIHTSLRSPESGLGEGQLIQTTNQSCTDIHFNVFSPHDFEELIVYADGPCKEAKQSQGKISISFIPCTCPIGFQPTESVTSCFCQCDSKLIEYITVCNIQNETFVRKGNSWINYINGSNVSGYVLHPYCPLDYCHPPGSRIEVNLNIPNGADAQCAKNHSGKLCGTCKLSLSLSLSSSQCIQCPSYWSALVIVILIAAIIAGIALVAILLVLNLTVAVGTLNGIIFYANIVNANSSTFFPFNKSNYITVFIAWLNLELGFDTCFFEGMDAYWRTLFQLAFPLYLVSLVVLIIVISEHSSRFSRLIGKKNPVATLATLILLSYTKFLHIIIASFSFAVLYYPNGTHEVVWLPDATVSYLEGKHVILFLIALLVLLAGFAYTALLLSWQWLLYYQNKKILKWTRYHRLYMFLEPYHAPYTFKHRYWTGLLLLIRVALYIISATNVSRDPGVNLLAIGMAMTGLLLLKGYSKINIYKKWPLDILEMTCYVNVIFFCLVQFFALAGNRDGTAIAYFSSSLTLVLLLIVLAYHIYMEIFSKTVIKLLKQSKQGTQSDGGILESDSNFAPSSHFNKPTCSVVDRPTQGELPLTVLLETKKKDKQGSESFNSYHLMSSD